MKSLKKGDEMADNKDGSDAPVVPQTNGTRVPKKRFVGRKTAEAQAQRTGGDVEQSHTTAIQTGMGNRLEDRLRDCGALHMSLAADDLCSIYKTRP